MKNHTPIAVVGMGGVFPGASEVHKFWRNIINKKSAVVVVPEGSPKGSPKGRWIVPVSAMYDPKPKPDKAFSHKACLIDADFGFDPDGFALEASLIRELDPLYHMTLHAGRQALSACQTDGLDKNRMGVTLAAIALPTDASSAITREIMVRAFEQRLFPDGNPVGLPPLHLTRNQCLSAKVTSLPGAILARGLGLGGGSFTLDAACASSLYAVKLACDDLASGRADLMLAGGVSRPECLYTQVGFTQLRALSPSGRCAPFDKTADGLVVGEGAGILALKRLEDAVSHGDTVYAVIRGIGLSNDMRGNLLAPDTEGQIRAMRAAYEAAGWTPTDADLIECHGAGTPVGDMTEQVSLKTLWEEIATEPGVCPIGSVKSMVGHLLTGAGAAGMIKVLLGLHYKTLPPSLNFTEFHEKSPLIGSPFRVQTEPDEWKIRNGGIPRRAAVSAFGFGGINAHLLFEEYRGDKSAVRQVPSAKKEEDVPVPVAIIGMAASVGELQNLRAFQEAALGGKSAITERPEHRWRGAEDAVRSLSDLKANQGAFLSEFSIELGRFGIPPNEIPDILTQQLLMLRVGAEALADAEVPQREYRPRMGVTIGMEFDFEDTDFHLRWHFQNLIDQWAERLNVDALEKEAWLEQLRDAWGPPLTPSRVLGSLGGIVASRIAREFRLGGPSFTVSCDAASGLKALEIGVRSLQAQETDLFLVGAVDLFGDVRNLAVYAGIQDFSQTGAPRPFDKEADGMTPGEGALALVLKPLPQAMEDGDRIYAVIRGMGGASGGGVDVSQPEKSAYLRSLRQAVGESGISLDRISFVETHGCGEPASDALEADALHESFVDVTRPPAIGSLKPVIGHAGAVSGLASVVRTALCLYQEIIPPLKNYTSPGNEIWDMEVFHIPAFPQFWHRNREEGPRSACVASMTTDGNCAHLILEGAEPVPGSRRFALTEAERKRPIGDPAPGLFILEGETAGDLLRELEGLETFCRTREDLDRTAREWFARKGGPDARKPLALSLAATDGTLLEKWIREARKAVESGTPRKMMGKGGVSFFPEPLGNRGEIAFVYPGSGNHYAGMGRDLGVRWPEILREMDAETPQLLTQMVPTCYMPWRVSWEKDWEAEAYQKIISDPLFMIFGQVVHGGMVTRLVNTFGVRPDAVIGYSLGESAGYFATGAWADRGEMLKRMRETPLFTTELAGPCNALRKAWNIPGNQKADWRVAVINRPASAVREVIGKFPHARLLIVNTPEECVIGGLEKDVANLIQTLKCEGIFLDGVVTVHCDAALPASDAYRALHLFPTTPPPGIRYYSGAWGKVLDLTTETAAESILRQATHGFDFPAVIEKAYGDGVRIFLEMGPQGSCRRMIDRILGDRPHSAFSACARGEDDYLTVLKFLGTLAAERVPVDLARLYGDEALPPQLGEAKADVTGKTMKRLIGGMPPSPTLPARQAPTPRNPEPEAVKPMDTKPEKKEMPEVREAEIPAPIEEIKEAKMPPQPPEVQSPPPEIPSLTEKEKPLIFENPETPPPSPAYADMHIAEEYTGIPADFTELLVPMQESMEATAAAHEKFLDFSDGLVRQFCEAFVLQNQLLEGLLTSGEEMPPMAGEIMPPVLNEPVPNQTVPDAPPSEPRPNEPPPAFPKEMCMEFAVGSVAKVLGPMFAEVDTYPVRVRLPDDPLMLVHRIHSVEGEKGGMGAGRVVTAHDVREGAWYLDGNRTPVCISVEAGQADLFLCSYLGIDLKVKGKRAYRLLDAKVRFHRGLPRPGETIYYDIHIDKFVRQGEVYMFFFRFEGTIDGQPLISMRDGCAGFFTPEEVNNSGGIILKSEEMQPAPGRSDVTPLVSVQNESYSDAQIEALRAGQPESCFGPDFADVRIGKSQILPGGQMRLLDRVSELAPQGGRFGLGMIRAEADIHPDDWFLTCHFVDDMVMPGTLMYECCAHTLRILLQRIGWVSANPEACWEPVIGIEAVLKCRGPVTPETRQVLYEVEIKEIGYGPEPYVIADALMYGDGRRIVQFTGMSMKLSGVSREEIESFWAARRAVSPAPTFQPSPAIYTRGQLLAFCEGNPSEAFGEPYKPFDRERTIARLPRPPYFFMDRVTRVEPPPWELKAGGWIEAEYEFTGNEWYFQADRSGIMPYCILLEIALQPCGWLAAYVGSALRSEKDLKFRNLGGKAVLNRNLRPKPGMLTMRSRLTQVSEAGGMIIENFDMEVLQNGEMIYKGDTYFGFFSAEALANQVGIPGAREKAYEPPPEELARARPLVFPDEAPLNPFDSERTPAPLLAMPGKALRMIDRVECWLPEGGPSVLGFIRGVKDVDVREWFFDAHFHQDPVCPGSLGIESFIQLMKFAALERWGHLAQTHRFEMETGAAQEWIYRGQIIQKNRQVVVDAVITQIEETPYPLIRADGYLKVDGLFIYQMKDFGLRLVPVS